MALFNGWGSTASRLQSHFEEAVSFSPLSSPRNSWYSLDLPQSDERRVHAYSNCSNLEMDEEFLMKNLPYLNLNTSRIKNSINKLQKILEQGRVIEHTVFISLR